MQRHHLSSRGHLDEVATSLGGLDYGSDGDQHLVRLVLAQVELRHHKVCVQCCGLGLDVLKLVFGCR